MASQLLPHLSSLDFYELLSQSDLFDSLRARQVSRNEMQQEAEKRYAPRKREHARKRLASQPPKAKAIKHCIECGIEICGGPRTIHCQPHQRERNNLMKRQRAHGVAA